MEDQKLQPIINDAFVNKPRKKKSFPSDSEMVQSLHGETMKKSVKGQKPIKRGLMKMAETPPLVQQERLVPDSVPESSASSGNEYRVLRRKYLLLEEESFGLGRELEEVEDEIKSLEDEKLSLLDELVVLEGLVDPSDLQHQAQRMP